jgi:DNA replication protein DnaC
MGTTENIIMEKLQEKASQYSTEELDGLDQSRHKCQKCKDIGGTFGKKQDEETGRTYEIWIKCDCSKQTSINRLLNSSEITDSFKKMGFGNFQVEGKADVITEARDCAMGYFKNYESIKENRNNSIALLGRPGAGKTHLLTAVGFSHKR